jgi:YD repeat-containing protein
MPANSDHIHITLYGNASGRVVADAVKIVKTGPVFRTAYDAVGNVISQTDALGNVTTTFYDNLYRPIETFRTGDPGLLYDIVSLEYEAGDINGVDFDDIPISNGTDSDIDFAYYDFLTGNIARRWSGAIYIPAAIPAMRRLP